MSAPSDRVGMNKTPDPFSPRIVIAGGGTGGHLYPGIAVAREVLARHPAATISFAGRPRGSRRESCRARDLPSI